MVNILTVAMPEVSGMIRSTPYLAADTSPKVTAYLMSLVNPSNDVLESAGILRNMSSDHSHESPQ